MQNPWQLYDELIAGVPEGIGVRSYHAGPHWIYVEAECGVGISHMVPGGAFARDGRDPATLELHELAARTLEEAGFGPYFTHGLGHGVGIDIHELPVAGKRGDLPLEVGSVFTIEPGVYLPGEFGIRLEDCGVMTEGGYEPFTQSPHELVCVG